MKKHRVEAGRLRHWVSFEAVPVEPVLDSDGRLEEVWLPAFSGLKLPAEITPLSGRELIAAQGVNSKVSTRIKLRHRDGFAARMRALHRGVIYNVEAVISDPDSGIRYVTLLCTSGVNEG